MKGERKTPLHIPAYRFDPDNVLNTPFRWPGEVHDWKKRPITYSDDLPIFWTNGTSQFTQIFAPSGLEQRIASPRKFGKIANPIMNNPRSVILAGLTNIGGHDNFNAIVSAIGAAKLDQFGVSLFTTFATTIDQPLLTGVPLMDKVVVNDKLLVSGLPNIDYNVPVPKPEQFIAGETLVIYGTPMSLRLPSVSFSWYLGSYPNSGGTGFNTATVENIRAQDADSLQKMIANSKKFKGIYYFPSNSSDWVSSENFAGTGYTNRFVPDSPTLTYSMAQGALNAALSVANRPDNLVTKTVVTAIGYVNLGGALGLSSNTYTYDPNVVAADIIDFFGIT